jgi:peptidoglycan hydrolase CwlO-like protein
VEGEAELSAIEEEIDNILRARLAKSAVRNEGSSEIAALIASVQQLENLIYQRGKLLTRRASPYGKTG